MSLITDLLEKIRKEFESSIKSSAPFFIDNQAVHACFAEIKKANEKFTQDQIVELLFYAAVSRNSLLMGELYRFINTKNSKGLTVFHFLFLQNLHQTAVDFKGKKVVNFKGDERSIVSLACEFLLESYGPDILAKTPDGKTPADLAREKEYEDCAELLYEQEFLSRSSEIHWQLKGHFAKRQRAISDKAQVKLYIEKLLLEVIRLSCTVTIPSSEIDGTISSILTELGIDFSNGLNGFELPLPEEALRSLNNARARKLYDLTCIGEMEKTLRAYVVDCLKDSLKDKAAERVAEHNAAHDQEWGDYWEDYNDYEEGEYEGEDDEPSSPKRPKIEPMYVGDEKAKIEKLSVEAVLKQITLPNNVLREMLYSCFIDEDLLGTLIEGMDFRRHNLDPVTAVAVLGELDFQFCDVDIRKPGFLIEVFRLNFERNLDKAFHNYEVATFTDPFVQFCIKHPKLVSAFRAFNSAGVMSSVGQGVWVYLQKLMESFHNWAKERDKDKIKILGKKLEEDVSSMPKFDPEKGKLVKVFPTDGSGEFLFCDQHKLPLRPIFKTLYTIAAEAHKIVEKYSKRKKSKNKRTSKGSVKEKADPTNVVTSVLVFAVSIEGNPEDKVFVQIPLDFDYPTLLLSKDPEDGVFKNQGDFDKSVARDRDASEKIVGKILAAIPDKSMEAKQKAEVLLEGFVGDADAKRIMDEVWRKVESTGMSKPLMIDYACKKDVQRQTEFYHSERVVLHALKSEQNVGKILTRLEEELRQRLKIQGRIPFHFILEGCALIFYSYPNSVCNECCGGFIALQNSEQEGFIRLVLDKINQPTSIFRVSGNAAKPNLSLKVIGSSASVFRNDSQAALVKGKPFAKLDLSVGDGQAGISIRVNSDEERKCFIEFVESDIHQSRTHVPFPEAMIAMSGSKGKLARSDRPTVSTKLKEAIKENNDTATKPNTGNAAEAMDIDSIGGVALPDRLLSFSQGHRVAPSAGAAAAAAAPSNSDTFTHVGNGTANVRFVPLG